MRLFHFKLAYSEDGSVLARLSRAINVRGQIENCEGIACIRTSDDTLTLLLSDRGGSERNPDGRLYWGTLDLCSDEFIPTGPVEPFHLRLPESGRASQARACSDLFVDESGTLWGVGAFDPDREKGAFWSVIYKIGRMTSNPQSPIERELAPRGWRVDGLKVEALAASIIPNTSLCFATDDEQYGGVWRPLGKPLPLPNDGPKGRSR